LPASRLVLRYKEVWFTSTAKGVTNEGNALANPHQVIASQIPAVDVVGTHGSLVADGISAGLIEEHTVKLTADPTVNNNKAWYATEDNCTTAGHSSRGSIRLTQWQRYAETQYKLRLFEDNGLGTAPDMLSEILPSEGAFNWEYDASAGLVYFDDDPGTNGKTTPLWGVFYTYVGDTVEDGLGATTSGVDSLVELFEDTQEPSGFINTTDSALTFDDGTMTLTISGTEYDYYIVGQKYTKNGADSLALTDTEGMHYFYYDGGSLTHTTTFSYDLIYNKAYVAAVYWDATNNTAVYIGDERHGITMDGQTHAYLHESLGTTYVDGLALTDILANAAGNNDNQTQFGVASGHIRDEDLLHTIATQAKPAQLPVFYKSGANGDWRMDTPDNFPYKPGGTYLNYNEWTGSTWQQTEVNGAGDDLTLVHVFATNDITYPIIVVQGQAEYIDLASAREGATEEINNLVLTGLPFVEFVPLGTVIYQCASGYTTTHKCKIRGTADAEDYVDWRYSGLTPLPQSVSDHANLTGRDKTNQHPASSISADYTTFSGILTSSDDTVQKALETIDQNAAGDKNKIYQADSSVTVIDTSVSGVSPYVETKLNDVEVMKIRNPSFDVDEDLVTITNTGYGGALKLDLDSQTVGEDSYYAFEISMSNATPQPVYADYESIDAFVNVAGATTDGEAVDVYGAYLYSITNGSGYYGSLYGANIMADVRTGAHVDWVVGASILSRQYNATEPIVGLEGAEVLTRVQGSGKVDDVYGILNTIDAGSSANMGNVYGEYIEITTRNTTDITGNLYMYYGNYDGDATLSGTAWGLYIDGAEKNYIEGETEFAGDTRMDEGYKAQYGYSDEGAVYFETLHMYVENTGALGSVVFNTNSTYAGEFDNSQKFRLSALTPHDTAINEFSTDTTLSGNSDDAVPTEKAVKTYVDNTVGDVDFLSLDDTIASFTENRILFESSSAVIDDTDLTYNPSTDTFATTNIDAAGNVSVSGTFDFGGQTVDEIVTTITSPTDSQLVTAGAVDDYLFGSSGAIAWEVVDTPYDRIQPRQEYMGLPVYTPGDMTVGGDLTVTGTLFYTDVETVQVADNIIHVNYGEVGAGVTAGQAGLQVDRGTQADYYFVFDEPTDTFRVGVSGTLQAVATREDNPVDTRVPWWNDTEKRFDTAGTTYITVNSGTGEFYMTTNGYDTMYVADDWFAIGDVTNYTNAQLYVDSSTNIMDFMIGVTSYFQTTANTQRLGLSTAENITVNQTSNWIDFEVANTSEMRITADGLNLKTGATVNEIVASTGSLSAASTDDQLATAKLIYDEIQDITTGSGSITHNLLDGLQGGVVGEYYHLTYADYLTVGHSHPYASDTHNHDGVYSPVGHNHDSDYAALVHTHDDRYYTETEVDNLLAGLTSEFIELTDVEIGTYTANNVLFTTASGVTDNNNFYYSSDTLFTPSINLGTGGAVNEITTTVVSGSTDSQIPTAGAVWDAVEAAAGAVHTHYDVDGTYVSDTSWTYGSGFSAVPDDLQIFVNGVKQRIGATYDCTVAVPGGVFTITFLYNVQSSNWVNITYTA